MTAREKNIHVREGTKDREINAKEIKSAKWNIKAIDIDTSRDSRVTLSRGILVELGVIQRTNADKQECGGGKTGLQGSSGGPGVGVRTQ